jgi:hypothetical protein
MHEEVQTPLIISSEGKNWGMYWATWRSYVGLRSACSDTVSHLYAHVYCSLHILLSGIVFMAA